MDIEKLWPPANPLCNPARRCLWRRERRGRRRGRWGCCTPAWRYSHTAAAPTPRPYTGLATASASSPPGTSRAARRSPSPTLGYGGAPSTGGQTSQPTGSLTAPATGARTVRTLGQTWTPGGNGQYSSAKFFIQDQTEGFWISLVFSKNIFPTIPFFKGILPCNPIMAEYWPSLEVLQHLVLRAAQPQLCPTVAGNTSLRFLAVQHLLSKCNFRGDKRQRGQTSL